MRQHIRAFSFLASALLIAGCGGSLRVNEAPTRSPLPVPAEANPVDESRMVTLRGNVHPLARPEFDQGLANPATRLDRMLLVLNSSPTQHADLDALLAAQQDSQSLLYHQWLTPAEFGARFGASDADLAQVTAWLAAQGFIVDEIPAGRRLVAFSGSAAQVAAAFHTTLHIYRVDGTDHLANAEDPQIPVGLSGLIAGIVSLHNFRRTSEMGALAPLSMQPEYSAGATHYLFPADFATIYDLNPLFAEGTNGAGSSIAIAARSNIKLSDVEAFRSMAALPANDPIDHSRRCRSGTRRSRSGRVHSGGRVERSGRARSRRQSRRRRFHRNNRRHRPRRRIHRESLRGASGECELRQLRAADGRSGARLLQQPLGTGSEPGYERLRRLRRRRRSRLLCTHSHRRFATRSQWSLFVALLHLRRRN